MIFQRASQRPQPIDDPPEPVESRPRYVNRWALLASPQPFVCEDLAANFFLLRAKAGALQFLCDRYLNLPGQDLFKYSPLADLVVLYFNRADKVYCQDPVMQQLGFGTETNVAFIVPTLARRRVGDRLVDDHVVLFFPYMWVDNPVALTLGREIYGFPKELGWMTLPNDVSEKDPVFRLDGFALRRFDSKAKMARQLLLEVGPPRNEFAVRRPEPGWFDGVRRLVFGDGHLQIPGVELLQSTFMQAANQEVMMVCLMQFYDPEDGARACYQAIVEAPARVTRFGRPMPINDPLQLSIHPAASHPIASELGLDSQTAVAHAFHVSLAVTMGRGKTIWRAQGGAQSAPVKSPNGRVRAPVRSRSKE